MRSVVSALGTFQLLVWVAVPEAPDGLAVIGFDEQPDTLQAIKDGHCHGTVVQNPYEYAYRSLELLAPEGTVIELSWYGDRAVSVRPAYRMSWRSRSR